MNLFPQQEEKEELIQLKRHIDGRGWFMELWRGQSFVQENIAFSKRGVLRGMHSQRPQQGKLVSCISGSIYDVVLEPDGSAWRGYTLTPGMSLWIPPQYYHGYQALEDSIVTYAVTSPYNPEGELRRSWNRYGIEWPIDPPILSEKDA